MSYELRYFDETITPGATVSLPPARRLLYIFSGSAAVDGRPVAAADGVFSDGATEIAATAADARLFRWDLVPQGSPPTDPPSGTMRSILRMAQPIWSLDIVPGSQWLFRLDMIDNPAGVVADVHTHPGPGIRALLTGTFHVRQPSEEGAATAPGDPWWESGVEAVISTPSETQDSSFLRGMLLPPAYRGRPDTAKWLRRPLRIKSTWRLYVDEIVTL